MTAVIIIISIIAFFLLADICAGIFFFRFTVARNNRFHREQWEKLYDAKTYAYLKTEWERLDSYMQSLSNEEWTVISNDGLILRATYFSASLDSKKTAIVIHGYQCSADGEYQIAKLYSELGYNVLIPSLRSHDKSEGKYIGFGWLDRKDIILWIQKTLLTTGNDTQIILNGRSMGGAAVLMTSGEELPGNVKAIISDSAYTTVFDELSHQIKKAFKLPPFPFVNTASAICRLVAGYSFSDASALKQVKKSRTPVLFIHGEADNYVPFKMAHELYAACGSEKYIFHVPEAEHTMSYQIDAEGYKKTVTSFLNRYVSGHAAEAKPA